MAIARVVPALLVAASVACAVEELPEIVVFGSAADAIEFSEWEQVVIGGKVVKWQGQMTRRSETPVGYMVYVLYDERGEMLSRGSLDYRSSFLYDGQRFDPGSVLPISIAAYRGDAYGNDVARIEIEVREP